ncbi:hypothetical protein COL10_03485 [Bacillus cereus]|uniref:DEAD/DEAH box helicase family protein n=1 Tax=Bacillus cereus TaxID=1396 RepID=UPI000BED2992|nr:DEAD/DEAH box helicase family protein [Bacillus cereus]PEF92569.1 hypothetical protein CON46_11385 [Bacillus cereus]PFD76444.1 hypothetical protein CN301_05345 [Bacillus cereus]PFV13692.1 hypothetical protein COL10_03485 [Bacillus cereus]PGV45698.1 hypothetical protein COD74_10990 [Bacillus cereus]
MTEVKVVDSLMGTGKTNWAIDYMSEEDEKKKFMYITPYRDEIERIRESVKNRTFHTPDNKNSSGTKLQSIKKLLAEGKDIASTHALFKSFDDEVIELIRSSDYELILDEALEVIELQSLKESDYNLLLESDLIIVNEDNRRIIWNDSEEYEGRFEDIKIMAERGNLYLHTRNSGKSNVLLVWTFPIQVFTAFSKVFNLTYMFEGQLQYYYFKMFNVQFEYKSVEKLNGKYELVNYKDKRQQGRDKFKELINIYEGRMNTIGEKKHSLSSSWLRRTTNKYALKKLKTNIESFFKNYTKTKSKQNAWTTIKGEVDGDSKAKVYNLIKGNGYSKGFIPCNARATNQYRDRFALAYALNKFMNPMQKSFFEDRGIDVNEDLFALSELLQWIWRSRVRNGENIHIFIPSKRMRELLFKYLDGEI